MEARDQEAFSSALRCLIERCRTKCLRDMPKEFMPQGKREAALVLHTIAYHGDRTAFDEAQRLLTWLARQAK